MALKAAAYIVDNNLFVKLAIPPHAVPLIQSSWEAEPPSLYGRFDLSWDGLHPPKLLEYNADTPTSLLEASVDYYDIGIVLVIPTSRLFRVTSVRCDSRPFSISSAFQQSE